MRGQPLFRRAFITCPIFSFSSHFTSRGISSWTCIMSLCHYVSCLYVGSFFVNTFLIRLSDFRHGITLEFAGPVFSMITVAESNGCYVFATYGLCVWGQPLFRRAFITCPILVSVPNLQAGAHGILDPPCATKLRSWMGYQG